MKKNLKILVCGAVVFFCLIATILPWVTTHSIAVPLRPGMTEDEVDKALKTDTAHTYDFWENGKIDWWSRSFLSANERFGGATWIQLRLDSEGRLESGIGYNGIGGNLPIIGRWEFSFGQRKIRFEEP